MARQGGFDETLSGKLTPERAERISSWTSQRRESAIGAGTLTGGRGAPTSSDDEDAVVPEEKP